LSPVSCLPSLVSCLSSPVSCPLSPVSCLLSPLLRQGTTIARKFVQVQKRPDSIREKS
jgi:hypothetical protein